VGVEASTPLEQAYPLVFLCSDAAVAITGTTMITDAGYFAAGMTETFPDATPAVHFLLGRY
jgi:enoyl-[acyl-carrier-protein] reductase (NADH)